MTYTEKTLDVTTNKETIRNYTKEEIATVEQAIQEADAISKASAEKALAKSALLQKLGISESEAALLLS
jgi:hypothetical protein